MIYGLKIAFRHVSAHIAQTSLLVLGVAVAVFIFIFMSALIGGLADLMVIRTLGNFSHVTIEQPEPDLPLLRPESSDTVLFARQKPTGPDTGLLNARTLMPVIEALPGVTHASPQILGNGVLIRGEQIRQVGVIGVMPERVSDIVDFKDLLVAGDLRLGGTSVLIGATLAEELNLSPGRTVSLRVDNGNAVTLDVAGIFWSGTRQLDRASAYIDIATARTVFNVPQAVTRIEVKLADLFDAGTVAQRIETTTGLAASPWTDGAEELYEALKAQKDTGTILKAFALVTIVIGIASALMLSTYRRRPEIGIMRAMGATRGFILFVFITQGAIIGLAGGLAGAMLGFIALFPLPAINEVEPGQLPIDLAQGSIGLAIVLTTVGATLAAILPARAASRVDPVTAIGQ